jgi:hypothetical protein
LPASSDPRAPRCGSPYSAADIEGEFDFEVEGGSTQPQNETFKRQQAMQLLQVLQPFVPMGVINVQELLAQVLRDGFGMKNPEKLILEPQPQVDPATGQATDPVTGQPVQDPNAPPVGPDGQPVPPQDPNAPQQGQALRAYRPRCWRRSKTSTAFCKERGGQNAPVA